MEMAVFALFALLALGSSLVVIAHKSPIYSTLSLVMTLFSVAVLFVLLGAPFIATLQLLIYAGAILVLFLFVIMLLNVGGREEGLPGGHRLQLITSVLGALVFTAMLWMLLRPALGQLAPAPLTEEMVSLSGLAQDLFADYLLPFEIVGLLLLVAVIGATVIARRPTPEELSGGGGMAEAGAAAAGPAPTYAAWAQEADRAAGGARPASVPGGSGRPGGAAGGKP
ncbi:MAG TPA: NADH-quinone oxidoreductase subunit J [Thermoanaerobaculia bacterium]|jgi:NADH-quinone oxidoreductase subunit J|nr:NADH-quinone oxidoreductase subunit J [Thermoanaerobaculia bacterium]